MSDDDEITPVHNDGKQARFKELNRRDIEERTARNRAKADTERAVSKPNIDALPDAVRVLEDGTLEFTLKKGDPIVIEYPFPGRPTQTVTVWVVGADGYLQTWSDDLHHFEFCNWRRATQEGVKLKVPDGTRLRRVRVADKVVKRVRREITGNTNEAEDSTVAPSDSDSNHESQGDPEQ
jgi:hypothetical protein